jgi:hypothetical protein
VNDEYRNTSLIRTLRERRSLGQPFSAREAIAADLGLVRSLETPRDPADWPEVGPLPVPAFDTAAYPPDLSLRGLANREARAGQGTRSVRPKRQSRHRAEGGEAISMIREMFSHMFPNLHIES